MDEKEKYKEEIKKIVYSLANTLVEGLGPDSEFMLMIKKQTFTCTICAGDAISLAHSLVMNIMDEENENSTPLYQIIKTTAAALLLMRDINVHADFEDCISECLFESLQQ